MVLAICLGPVLVSNRMGFAVVVGPILSGLLFCPPPPHPPWYASPSVHPLGPMHAPPHVSIVAGASAARRVGSCILSLEEVVAMSCKRGVAVAGGWVFPFLLPDTNLQLPRCTPPIALSVTDAVSKVFCC